jgi:4-hydroxybutyrate dehydrogenase/sulfolactaldehyde 3-reductase
MVDVAFIGLGTMGLSMAEHIVKGGYSVAGYDKSAEAVNAHVANGGIASTSAADAAKDCPIIVTILPNGSIVHSAIFDEGGVIESALADALLIDMSTIHPFETDSIRKELKEHNIRMLEAPVGRTSDQAKIGKSLFMVGAEPQDIETARPILECMGDTIIDCGGPGMGSRMKIVNNLMSTAMNVLTAEVLTFSDNVGLDRDLAIDVMNGTTAGKGHMSTSYPAKVLKGDLSPLFMVDLAKKDLDIALSLANEINSPLPMSNEAETIYADAQNEGRGAQDWTAIYAMLSEKYHLNK